MTKSEASVLRFLAGNPAKTKDVIVRSVNRTGAFALARLVRVGAVEVTEAGEHALTDVGRKMLSEDSAQARG